MDLDLFVMLYVKGEKKHIELIDWLLENSPPEEDNLPSLELSA